MSLQSVPPTSGSIAVKLTVLAERGDEQKHRFRVEPPTFAALRETIEQIVADAFAGSGGGGGLVVVEYVDDEDDVVRIGCDAELAEAVRVAQRDGVLRITARKAPGVDGGVVAASAAAAASASAASANPSASTNASTNASSTTAPVVVSADDEAFWRQVPSWLQAKIVARTAAHQRAVRGVAELPVGDAAHFAVLPRDVQTSLRANAKAHAERHRAHLAKKHEHHVKAAQALERKAQRYMAKANAQAQRAALKLTKLVEVDGGDGGGTSGGGGRDDDDGDKPAMRDVAEEQRLWAQVPAHLKKRVVARWLGRDAAHSLDAAHSFELWQRLPAHAQAKLRRHRDVARQVATDFDARVAPSLAPSLAPRPPAADALTPAPPPPPHYAGAAFLNAPAPSALPMPPPLV